MVRPPDLRQTGLRAPRCACVCAVAAAAALCGVTPLAAQNTVTVGSGRPAVEVNEEAIYFGLPGYNVPMQRYRAMPLYDPRNGRVLSRVLTLQPRSSAAPQLRPPMVGDAAPPLTLPRSRVVDLPPPRAAEKPPAPKPAPRAPVRTERKPAPPPPKPAPAPAEIATAKPPEPAPPPPKPAAPEAAPPPPQPAAPEAPPPPPKAAAPAPKPPAEIAATTPTQETPPPTRAAPRPTAPVTAGQPMTVLFSPGDAQLSDEFADALNQIAGQIKDDERARLQLKAFAAGGSTSPSAARRLSLSRALAVRSFLIEAGLSSTKIDVRALGAKYESGPPDRVDVVVLN